MRKKDRSLALVMCPGPWYRVIGKNHDLPGVPWFLEFEHPSESRCRSWVKSRYQSTALGKSVFIEPFDPNTGEKWGEKP